MNAILLDKFVESYDQLRVSNVDVPKVPYGYALVKVKAAGLNFVDLLYTRGKHQNNTFLHRPPFVLGLEFSGTIHSTNPPSLSTSTFTSGAAVYGSSLGSFAEYVTVPLAALRPIPSSWSFREAAGISGTLPVSYGALLRANVQAGETVLVHAAAGGLGLMAVQLAKTLGCVVIGTASSPRKLAVAKKFGCDFVVDYTKDDWSKEIMKLTGSKGVDIVYDPVGLVSESVRCTSHFGRILLIGFAGREGDMEKVAMNRLLLKQIQVIGYRYGETHRRRPEETAMIWNNLEKMIADGNVKPTVYEKDYRGLGSVSQAMYDMADRKVWGKAVIFVDDETDGVTKVPVVRAKM